MMKRRELIETVIKQIQGSEEHNSGYAGTADEIIEFYELAYLEVGEVEELLEQMKKYHGDFTK